MTGRTISHYKIVEKIGEGGMGVVYKAQDTKLERTVALKFLAPHAMGSEEQKARFIHEAKAAAALDHPNICTVHEIDEAEGQTFLAMAYVDGPSLKQKLEARPLKLGEALEIAIQIGQGLQAAHEKDIVHRDIKCSNVMLTRKGQVKIMDFGLARLGGRTKLTKTGAALGTPAYMSPEQARGEEADRRTDIWSLGVVLYEMVTGQLPFAGEIEEAVSYSILHVDPEPLTALRTGVPIELDRIVGKALAKAAEERYQHVDEMLVDLRSLERKLPASVKAAVTPEPGLPRLRPARWQRVVPWQALAGLAVAIAALALWAPWRVSRPSEQPVTRFVTNLPQGVAPGERGPGVALSPDGTQLVYVAQRGDTTQLYLRPLDQFDVDPIPGTEGAAGPFFSPDGNWVGFFADGKLKKVAPAGGAPLTLCDVEAGMGASWGPDDTIIFAPSMRSGLLKVPSTGGAAEVVTDTQSEQGELAHIWPQVLPGGKGLLFTVITSIGYEAQHAAVMSLQTGERRILGEKANYARYVPSGHLIYAQQGSLLAAPFDVGQLEMTGSPVRVIERVGVGVWLVPRFSFSRNGSLVYVPGGAMETSLLVWVDRRGNAQPIAVPQRAYHTPHLSPDGRHLAVTITDIGRAEIWVLDIGREILSRFTFDGNNHLPIWTPNGDRVVFTSDREEPRDNLYSKPPDGSGAAERLLISEHHQDAGSFSPDGKVLAFAELHPTTNWDVWLLDLEGERKAQPFLRTEFEEREPMISPDGRWLAYSSNESGRFEVYVQPFPGGGRKWQISTEGGDEPLWAKSGRELFYRDGDRLMVVSIETESQSAPGKPRVLFRGSYEGRYGFGYPNYDISPDGERFVMLQPVQGDSGATPIHVVLNWFEELKRLAPP